MASNKRTLRYWFQAESSALRNAIDRCSRPTHSQFRDYGGRGIKVADVFSDPKTGFAAFLADVGPRPDPSLTLDRKSNDLGYEPGNLAWTDRFTQQRNRRPQRTLAHDLGWGIGSYHFADRNGRRGSRPSPLIEYLGRTQTVRDWANEIGMNPRTIIARINKGWSVEKSLDATKFRPNGTPQS